MALNAKRERLKSLKEKEGVERRNCSSGIAEKYCANLGDKSRSSDILFEAYAVVARFGSTSDGNLPLPIQSNLPLSTITPPIAVPWPPINFVAE